MNLLTLYLICNQFGGVKKKWVKLYHNGVLFPPEYVKHNIPVIYNNKELILEKEAEEAATFYAKYTGTEYIENNKFRKNFWKDWKELLGDDHEIKSFDEVNFSLIREYLDKIKEEKKIISHEEKDIEKKAKEEEEKKYKIAYLDDKEEPIGNFRVEPPGIFLGRGDHPKIGRLKKRIYPEDVTLNLSKDAPVPETIQGHNWGNIVHDRTVDWLASWKDTISGKMKYVWLGAHSITKGLNDAAKFDVARKLKKKIKGIREQNFINMTDSELIMRQKATAVYFIDVFALRVGNEKGEDEADTVGVTSLRVEHITIFEDSQIKLDFLGKDSVRYLNTVSVDPLVYNNLNEFIKDKTNGDQLFDMITTNDVNKYLQTFMKGLTAKVFRTYNASYLFQKELAKVTKKYETYQGDDKIKLLLEEFNKANLKVAKQMNHQKKISKSYTGQVIKISEQIKELRKKMKNATSTRKTKIKMKISELKTKKNIKSEMKNLSLGTSKTNYIDPRITTAFIKIHNIPIDKLFTKALQDKFKWAFDVDLDYKF